MWSVCIENSLLSFGLCSECSRPLHEAVSLSLWQVGDDNWLWWPYPSPAKGTSSALGFGTRTNSLAKRPSPGFTLHPSPVWGPGAYFMRGNEAVTAQHVWQSGTALWRPHRWLVMSQVSCGFLALLMPDGKLVQRGATVPGHTASWWSFRRVACHGSTSQWGSFRPGA